MLKVLKGDKFLLFLSLSVSLGCIYLLYSDFLLDKDKGSDLSIASLKSITNVVKIKNVNSASWTPAALDAPLYQDQLIFCGENSSTSVKFNDGTILKLKSDSLVRLNKDSTFKVFNGQIDFKATKELFIQIGDRKIKIAKGSSINIQNTKEQELKLDVFEGSAIVKTQTGEDLNIDQNTTVNINKSDKVEIKVANIALLSPRPYETNYSPNNNLELKWSALDEADRYIVKFFNNANNVLLEEVSTKRTELKMPDTIQCEDCAVQILAFKDNEENGRSLKVSYNQIELVAPTLNASENLEFKTRRDSTEVNLSWNTKPYFKSYEFSYNNESKSVTEPSIALELILGEHQVKVRGVVNDNIKSVWSKNFLVKVIPPPPLSPPINHANLGQKVYNPLDRSERFRFNFDKEQSLNENIEEYIIEVSKTSDFDKNETRIVTTSRLTPALYIPEKDGVYFIRAQFINEEGIKSQWGSIYKVILKSPPLLKPVEIIEEDEIPDSSIINVYFQKMIDLIIPSAHADEGIYKIPIKWKIQKDAKHYIVELQRNSKKIAETIVETNQHELIIDSPGSYRYRITAVDIYNRNGIPTKFKSFKINPKKIAISSEKNFTLEHYVGKDRPELKTTWETSIFEDGFHVDIKGPNVDYRDSSSNNEHTFTYPKSGTYKIKVSSKKFKTNKAHDEILIKYINKLQKVQYLNFDKDGNNLNISWVKIPGADLYHIEIADNTLFQNSYKKTVSDNQLSLPREMFRKKAITYLRVEAHSEKYINSNSPLIKYEYEDQIKLELALLYNSTAISEGDVGTDDWTGSTIGTSLGVTNESKFKNRFVNYDLKLEYSSGNLTGKSDQSISRYNLETELSSPLEILGNKINFGLAFSYHQRFFSDPTLEDSAIESKTETSIGTSVQEVFRLSKNFTLDTKIGIRSLSRIASGDMNYYLSGSLNRNINFKLKYFIKLKYETYSYNLKVNTNLENQDYQVIENETKFYTGLNFSF